MADSRARAGKMRLEHLIVPKSMNILKELWKHVNEHRNKLEGLPHAKSETILKIKINTVIDYIAH